MVDDAVDQMAKSLKNIERYIAMNGLGGGSKQGNSGSDSSGGGSTGPPDMSKPSPENTARYFSTGPNPVAVEDTQFDYIGFGLMAEVVNIRFTDDIDIAFADPEQRRSNIITLKANESPFTIGTDFGINSAFMWVRKAESATNDPTMNVIAFK